MVYNMTAIANSTGILQFTQNVNSSLMNNSLGILILITVSVIAFINFIAINPDPRPALIGASFLAFIVSIIFKILLLVPDLTIFVTLGIFALSIAFGSNR